MKFEELFRKEPEKQYKVTGENLRIRVNFLNITHGSYKMDFLIFQLLQIQDLFFFNNIYRVNNTQSKIHKQ